ncbi:MAG: hypothetical protein A2Y62_15475 [Candidatus Fischerbacteria bacterium RBG_13_37_8]|uniref:Phosphoribose diphosphate--decaprenyl-phosphate phosphoribosyltransferase n=1 Tax=Candidatus Fischerbacteria bacterium RBG_13_37_8 TaxID=1817863 RepID=A0A1F5VL29_9BACT|nr:MAG: hypothetical protein A2Y62_15475 [Candidatus Fischerbacteria bacterium RBG_13_37_8]
MKIIKALIKSMRMYSYSKNAFVAAPLIFANQLTNLPIVISTIKGVILFCLLSSAVYILNDVRDVEIDRKHPQNKNRPVASGILPVWIAMLFSLLLFAFSLGSSYLLNKDFFILSLLYALFHIIYSFGLKHISIVESFIVAIGFIIRVMAGSILVLAPASEWIILATFFLALVLVLGKRKCEFLRAEKNNLESSRPVLKEYTSSWLDHSMSIAAASATLTYALYCISSRGVSIGGKGMVFTVIPVLLGLYRYMQLVSQGKMTEDIGHMLFKDILLLSSIFIWLVMLILLIYLT